MKQQLEEIPLRVYSPSTVEDEVDKDDDSARQIPLEVKLFQLNTQNEILEKSINNLVSENNQAKHSSKLIMQELKELERQVIQFHKEADSKIIQTGKHYGK